MLCNYILNKFILEYCYYKIKELKKFNFPKKISWHLMDLNKISTNQAIKLFVIFLLYHLFHKLNLFWFLYMSYLCKVYLQS